jgi:transposase
MNTIGIDVSKVKLDCAWLKEDEKIKAKAVDNTEDGWKELIEWSLKNTGLPIEQLHFVMEATGIYHQRLATYLFDAGAKVSVVNPAQVKFYGQSLGVRTKNDKKDSVVLARYGFKENPKLWQPEALEVRELKALVTRLEGIEKDLQREKNRQEKALCGQTPQAVLDSISNMIELLETEQQKLEKLIEEHIDKHKKFKEDKALLETIPGVGNVIATRMLMVISSRQFTKASQCAAYLGLVPVQHESGSSVKGRSHLSKAGNPAIRAKLYFGAVSAKTYNPDVKALYDRLLSRGKSKMSALGAAMRKLVQICFGVLKHQKTYQPQTG